MGRKPRAPPLGAALSSQSPRKSAMDPRIWGPERCSRPREELALEALAGWEHTNCGAGVVRVRPPCEEGPEVPVAVVHNIVSTSLLLGAGEGSMPINLQVFLHARHATQQSPCNCMRRSCPAAPTDAGRANLTPKKKALALCVPCSSYNRRRFAAITIRVSNPRCTALLFTSGKLVITGVRSWYECLLASLCISRIVNRALPCRSYAAMNCEIQNVVARSEVGLSEGQRLDIQAMYETHSIDCTFQVQPPPPRRIGGALADEASLGA